VRRHLPLGLALLALVLSLGWLASARARKVGAAPLERASEGATFRFDPSIPAGDQAAIRLAVAHARPEAQRLIARVDGRVRIRVGDPGQGAIGTTETTRDGWTVTVDLGAVWPRYGQRGVDRLVLHELGHVVDGALVDDATMGRLDAGIPRGWGCADGFRGACASVPERFAESFMKWATDDIGVDVWLGYEVPPPGPSLGAWGAPLARLGAHD
jgi:hypothetical protein